MRAAFVLFDGLTALDFVGLYDPLTRLRATPELRNPLSRSQKPIVSSKKKIGAP